MTFLIKRDHMFKKRYFDALLSRFKLRWGTLGLLSLKVQRFELVYLRGFKKILRRRSLRIKSRHVQPKLCFFLKPNALITAKSRNARMGAGVGAFIRVYTKLAQNKTFIEFKRISPF